MWATENDTTKINIHHDCIGKTKHLVALIECFEVKLVSDIDGTDDAKLWLDIRTEGVDPPAHNRNVTSNPPQLYIFSIFSKTNKNTEPSSF